MLRGHAGQHELKGASGAAVQRQTTMNLGRGSLKRTGSVSRSKTRSRSASSSGTRRTTPISRTRTTTTKNRAYPEIDRRIRETYIKESTAQKTKQYDMYKRFIRWASDRLDDNGIVGFITNRSYVDSKQDDGFRKVVLDEFSDLYIVDLGGDVRANGRVGNVFGIMTGVAVGFLVRRREIPERSKHPLPRIPDEIQVQISFIPSEIFRFQIYRSRKSNQTRNTIGSTSRTAGSTNSCLSQIGRQACEVSLR